MKRYSKFILPLIALFFLIFAIKTAFNEPVQQVQKPSTPPPTSNFKNQVAGVGIIEPQSENISVGTNLAGIVTEVYAKVGDKVTKGDKLFKIDDRDITAQLAQAKAQVEVARVEAADAAHQLSLYEKLGDKRAVSADELSRRQYASQLARSKVKLNEAQVKVMETSLERLTVTAPIDGTILKVDTRPGEYAQSAEMPGAKPLMIMGDIETMHVRVEIDETDALRFNLEAPAIGSLRGYKDKTKIPLQFVKKEPYVLPKRSLTGDGNERVDSRVMQLVYSFDNKEIDALVGQQMDVFIDAANKK